MSEVDNKVNKIISDVLRIDEGEIKDSLTPNDIEAWDSFSGMQLVSDLEREFNIRFEMEDVFDVYCLGDFKKIVKKKLEGGKSGEESPVL